MFLRSSRKMLILGAFFLFVAALGVQAQELAIRWGPILSQATPTSAVVAWVTTQPARCRLLCDGREFRSPEHKLYHMVKLDGLSPASDHEYYVEAFAGQKRAASDHFVFRTPPTQMGPWSFVVFGDTRSDHLSHKKVIDGVLRVTPRPWLAINTGDLVADGRKPELWDMFFRIEEPLVGTPPYYPVVGNHEKESEYYYRTFPVPEGGGPYHRAWYSFSFGGVLFIMLNSELDLAPQTKFLADQLKRAQDRGIRWKFVSFHEPPYSSGSHGGNTDIQKQWVPLFDKYGVTCVFNGHDHIYEHSLRKGVHYLVAGGGGAPRYPVHKKPNPYSLKAESTLSFVQVLVQPSSVIVRALRPDRSLIEQFVVR